MNRIRNTEYNIDFNHHIYEGFKKDYGNALKGHNNSAWGNALRYDGDVQHSIFGTLIPNKATVKDYLTVQHEGNRRVIGTIKNTKINLGNHENLIKIMVQTKRFKQKGSNKIKLISK